MRNKLLILLLAPLAAILLAPLATLAQPKPYYLADGLQDFSDQMIRQSNPVYVTMFGTDSLIISTSGTEYQYASTYKRFHGENFLRRTGQWGTSMPNFVFLYEKAIFLVEERGSYLLFHVDRNAANGLLTKDDKSDILRIKDSLRTLVGAINTKQRADDGIRSAALGKKIATAYILGLQSKRSDPILVRDIKKWSGNETTVVYIVDANYYITRNYRGEVLNKNIPAIIKYHKDGKCWIQWRAFGYEALGGGNFGTDLDTYTKTDYYIKANNAEGSMQLAPGVAYEVDCN